MMDPPTGGTWILETTTHSTLLYMRRNMIMMKVNDIRVIIPLLLSTGRCNVAVVPSYMQYHTHDQLFQRCSPLLTRYDIARCNVSRVGFA